MTLRFGRWFAPVILWTWGGVFVYFYASGRLQSLLHPSFRPLVLGTGLGLAATGLVLAFCDRLSSSSVTASFTDPSWCLDGCGRPHPASTAGGLARWFVLVFPLVGAALVSPDSFGASFVRHRDVSAVVIPSSPALPTAASPNNQSQYLKTDDAGHVKAELVDFRYAAQSPDLRRDFDHKTLEVIGQFLPTPGADRKQFTLTRLFMICCAADAQPINVTVETTASSPVPAGLPEMAWVRVTGMVRFEHTDQLVATPILTAKGIQPIPDPKEKYLY